MTSERTKVAVRRDPAASIGQPARMFIVCALDGAEITLAGDSDVECPRCHAVYDSAGWLLENTTLIRPVPNMGSVYRLRHRPCDAERHYVLEFKLLKDDRYNPEEEWSPIGGGPGLPTASYKTLDAALSVLTELESVDLVADPEAFWAVYERWEGR